MLKRGVVAALTLVPFAAVAQNAPPVPVVTRRVPPEYSPEARRAELQGTVLLAVDVAPDGTVADARVRRGLGLGLDERAVAAVKQWRYETGGHAAHEAVEVDFVLDPPHRWEIQGAAFTRSGAGGPSVVHPYLSLYTSPDPTACPEEAAEAIVTFRVEDDGATAEVGSAGTIGSAVAAAAVRAVETWRFQPFAAAQPGTISGRVLLECRPSGGTGNEAAGVYRIGGGVSQPSVLFKVAPEYSEEARQAKYQGTAILGVVVRASGRTDDIRVIKPLGMGLDEEAVLAVKQWRFQPGLKAGQPVDVRATIEINFKLL